MGLSKVLKKIGMVAVTVGPALISASIEVKKASKSGSKQKKSDSK